MTVPVRFPPLCVTGASGFLGTHLVERLQRTHGDCELRLLSRRVQGSQHHRGDLAGGDALRGFVSKGSTVVHLAYSPTIDNVAAARNLADATIEGEAVAFIHVSTAVVVGVSNQDVIDESVECRPSSPYEREKLAVEETLRERLAGKVPLNILRPTAIFGPGGKNLVTLAKHLARAPRPAIALRMSLMGRRQMNLVAVENVVEAVLHLIQNGGDGEPYIVTDDENASNEYLHVAQLLLDGMQRQRVSPFVNTSWMLPALLKLLRRKMVNPDTRFSAARLRASGYIPAVDFDTAVRNFAAWYANRNDARR